MNCLRGLSRIIDVLEHVAEGAYHVVMQIVNQEVKHYVHIVSACRVVDVQQDRSCLGSVHLLGRCLAEGNQFAIL